MPRQPDDQRRSRGPKKQTIITGGKNGIKNVGRGVQDREVQYLKRKLYDNSKGSALLFEAYSRLFEKSVVRKYA